MEEVQIFQIRQNRGGLASRQTALTYWKRYGFEGRIARNGYTYYEGKIARNGYLFYDGRIARNG